MGRYAIYLKEDKDTTKLRSIISHRTVATFKCVEVYNINDLELDNIINIATRHGINIDNTIRSPLEPIGQV